MVSNHGRRGAGRTTGGTESPWTSGSHSEFAKARRSASRKRTSTTGRAEVVHVRRQLLWDGEGRPYFASPRAERPVMFPPGASKRGPAAMDTWLVRRRIESPPRSPRHRQSRRATDETSGHRATRNAAPLYAEYKEPLYAAPRRSPAAPPLLPRCSPAAPAHGRRGPPRPQDGLGLLPVRLTAPRWSRSRRHRDRLLSRTRTPRAYERPQPSRRWCSISSAAAMFAPGTSPRAIMSGTSFSGTHSRREDSKASCGGPV